MPDGMWLKVDKPTFLMLLAIIVMAILFAVCGCAHYQVPAAAELRRWETPQKLTVHDMMIKPVHTRAAVQEVIDYALKELRFKGDNLKGWQIHLISTWIKIWTNEEQTEYVLADGFTYPPDNMVYVSLFQDCTADSALIHELGHIIHMVQDEDGDQYHNNRGWWLMVKDVEKRAIKDLCWPGYIHKDIGPEYNPTMYKPNPL